MKRMRAAGLILVAVLTFVALQALVAADRPEPVPLRTDASRVFIQPRNVSADVGDTFTATVAVDNAQDMVGYAFQMQWDTAVLTVTEAVDAGFLLEAPLTTEKKTAGTLSWEALVIPNPSPPPYDDGADGDGALVILTVEVVGSGISKLDLDSTKVEWYDADEPTSPHIPFFVGDGSVVVGGGFVYLPVLLRGYGP